MNKIVPILHNIRSTHNVGSIIRTCDGLGIAEIWVTGITPYPKIEDDERLPHVSKRATEQIAKTALGAQDSVKIRHFETTDMAVKQARDSGLGIVAIEQSDSSIELNNYTNKNDVAVLFGNEVEGIDETLLRHCDKIVEIPMHGKKESFNVGVTAGIVLYTMIN